MVKIENKGDVPAEDVIVSIKIPEHAQLVTERLDSLWQCEALDCTATIQAINVSEFMTLRFTIKVVNDFPHLSMRICSISHAQVSGMEEITSNQLCYIFLKQTSGNQDNYGIYLPLIAR